MIINTASGTVHIRFSLQANVEINECYHDIAGDLPPDSGFPSQWVKNTNVQFTTANAPQRFFIKK